MANITASASITLHRPMRVRIQDLQQSSERQFIGKIFPLNLVLLVTIICYNCNNLHMARASQVDHLQLNIGWAHGDGAVGGHPGNANGKRSELMEQILRDDVKKDFDLSIYVMNTMAAELQQFVQKEELTEGVGKQTKLMSSWVRSKGGSERTIMIKEFNFIFATFWKVFLPLVVLIIEQKPEILGQNDLDFRCKRAQELKSLKELSEHSSLYTIYLDIFFSELTTHCLMRKLALIELNRISPSPLVKQFVDIYLDLPTSWSLLKGDSNKIHELLAGRAMNFNLNAALAQHGTLSQAAKLVLDPRTALSLSYDPGSYERLVQEFYSDCQAHTAALGAIWGDLDSMSSYLSTQTSNLVQLNEKVKFVAPQLVYGSICSQLMNLPL